MTKRNIHNWLVGVWCLYECFLESYLPVQLYEHSKFISPIIGVILLVVSIYYLFRKHGENRNKTYDEVISQENSGNYFQLFILLGITEIEVYKTFGTWVKLSLLIMALMGIITVLIKEWTLKKQLITGVVLAHLFLGLFIYFEAKNIYVRQYGNEIIGSYWSKPNFKAKYMVNLSKSPDSKNGHVLTAIVHVFSETYESIYPEEDMWGREISESHREEYILLEKVFLENGSFLTFDDCNLKMGKKVYCLDRAGYDWYVELKEEKVE